MDNSVMTCKNKPLTFCFQVTSIDVAIHYQKNNSKGKMSADELLKFLSLFAKVKSISSDWKQVIIEDSAWMIDGEASPAKKVIKNENCENKNEKPGKDGKQAAVKAGRTRIRSEIAKFI